MSYLHIHSFINYFIIHRSSRDVPIISADSVISRYELVGTVLVAYQETDLLNANKKTALEASPGETALLIRSCFIRLQDKHGQETEFYKMWEYLK